MSSKVRVQTALVLLPVFLGILFFGGAFSFSVLVAVAAALGAREYQQLCAPGVRGGEAVFVPLWAVVLVFSFFGSPRVVVAALCAGTLVYLGGCIAFQGPRPDTLQRWGAALGAWVLVACFLGHGVLVRAHGIAPILYVAGTVWAGDTAAYYVGSAFGRHRLAPKVSPNKSVEGALASLGASALFAAAAAHFLPLPHGPVAGVALAVALNVAAQVGDLAESLLKRCAGIKDSGTLLPGHGGVLDRLDGFLLVLPLYAQFLGSGGG